MKTITLEDGKYKIIVPETKEDFKKERFRCLRHGEEWRDLTGDKMIGALCSRVLELEEQFKKFAIEINENDLLNQEGLR